MANPAEAPTVWHAAAATRLCVEPLDSLTAVFDRLSGQTHILATPMPEILSSLARAPATGAELLARLSTAFDLSAEGDPFAVIEARLHELAALGLVEAR